MATSHDCITPEQMALIREAPLFFVASAAPDLGRGPASQGPVNLSPKGGSPLHVIDDHRVAYLDYTGSGNQTARHAGAGGPVTLMVMSMNGDDAAVVRLFGTATVTPLDLSPLRDLMLSAPAAIDRAADPPGHRRRGREHPDQLRLRRAGVRLQVATRARRARPPLQGFVTMRRLATFLLLFLTAIAVACSGGSKSSTTAPTTAPTEVTAATSATQVPSSQVTAPKSTPLPCTSKPDIRATLSPQGIEVRGSDDFKAWTQEALTLIKTKAPDAYAEVIASVNVIESVSAGSGMVVLEKRYKVGDETAHVPGYERTQQLIWFAGTIVHDAHHSTLCGMAQIYSGKDAEVACLKVQKAALLKFETSSYFSNYLQGLIDGADDPVNQYWNNPNRHW